MFWTGKNGDWKKWGLELKYDLIRKIKRIWLNYTNVLFLAVIG
jgi:hypothetical protein